MIKLVRMSKLCQWNENTRGDELAYLGSARRKKNACVDDLACVGYVSGKKTFSWTGWHVWVMGEKKMSVWTSKSVWDATETLAWITDKFAGC